MRLHHVQISMPEGQEADARRFYAEGLGLREVHKPAELAGRGGCWFRAYDEAGGISAELHLGVDVGFTPPRRAHPALVVGNAVELERLGQQLVQAGFEVDWTERHTFPGYQRCHCRDPFGNRLEIMTPA